MEKFIIEFVGAYGEKTASGHTTTRTKYAIMKEIYFTTSTIFIPISIMGFANRIFGRQCRK
jgi:hypothetical protein